jgi:hypothetical protein
MALSFTSNVPQTDADVEQKWKEYQDPLLRRILSGLYKTKRAQGLTVLEAWEYTLFAHLDAVGKASK